MMDCSKLLWRQWQVLMPGVEGVSFGMSGALSLLQYIEL